MRTYKEYLKEADTISDEDLEAAEIFYDRIFN